MSKVVLLADLHLGVRNDSPTFHDSAERFFSSQLLPYIKNNDVKRIINLGDTFDRRKYISYYTLNRAKLSLFDPLDQLGVTHDIIVGNHDIPYKNTLEANSPRLLLSSYSGVNVIDEPAEITVDGMSILMLPWICDDNEVKTMDMLSGSRSRYCFGHLELAGFEMYRGSMHSEGLSTDLFSKFDMVLSGHYHHKSSRGNVSYLGTAYEMTWSDYNDPKGYHVLDTDSGTIEFIRNPEVMFVREIYNDLVTSIQDIVDTDFSRLSGKYVKIVVQQKSDPFVFDTFLDCVEKVSPKDVQIIDNTSVVSLTDEEVVNEAEDTLTILMKHTENLDMDTNKAALHSLLSSLYNEATSSL